MKYKEEEEREEAEGTVRGGGGGGEESEDGEERAVNLQGDHRRVNSLVAPPGVSRPLCREQ